MKTYTREELRLAQAKGCRIEVQDKDGNWMLVSIPVESLIGFDIYTLRIHPADEWKARLPRLREGAEWCCDGNGYEKARPHIVGETLKKDNVFGRANKGCRIMTTAPVPPEFLHPDELAKQPEASPENLCPCSFPHQPHDYCDGSPAHTRKSSQQAPDFGEPWKLVGEYIFNKHSNFVGDKARIIACVNALAGVPDPAEFVRQAMEMKEAIKEAHEALSTCWTAHKRSHREELLQGYNQNMVEASISKLELFLP